MASIMSNTQLAGAVVVAMLLYEPDDERELDWVRILLSPSEDEPLHPVVVKVSNYLRRDQQKSTDGYFVYTVQELKELAVGVIDRLISNVEDNEEQLRLVKFLINPDNDAKIPEAIAKALEIIKSSYRDNLEENN